MGSVKYNGRWYESSSLPLEIQIELGLKGNVKKELEKVPIEQKKSRAKRQKEEDND